MATLWDLIHNLDEYHICPVADTVEGISCTFFYPHQYQKKQNISVLLKDQEIAPWR